MNLKEIFGKSKSIKVIEGEHERARIIITRKSRFIRKDAEKLIERCRISALSPEKIAITIEAPLCSKAKQLIEENGYQLFVNC